MVKPGAINAKAKEKLTRQGNLVIEVNEFYNIKLDAYPKEEQFYVYTNCCCCGERIYMLKERMEALKEGKSKFYCSHGHAQNYK